MNLTVAENSLLKFPEPRRSVSSSNSTYINANIHQNGQQSLPFQTVNNNLLSYSNDPILSEHFQTSKVNFKNVYQSMENAYSSHNTTTTSTFSGLIPFPQPHLPSTSPTQNVMVATPMNSTLVPNTNPPSIYPSVLLSTPPVLENGVITPAPVTQNLIIANTTPQQQIFPTSISNQYVSSVPVYPNVISTAAPTNQNILTNATTVNKIIKTQSPIGQNLLIPVNKQALPNSTQIVSNLISTPVNHSVTQLPSNLNNNIVISPGQQNVINTPAPLNTIVLPTSAPLRQNVITSPMTANKVVLSAPSNAKILPTSASLQSILTPTALSNNQNIIANSLTGSKVLITTSNALTHASPNNTIPLQQTVLPSSSPVNKYVISTPVNSNVISTAAPIQQNFVTPATTQFNSMTSAPMHYVTSTTNAPLHHSNTSVTLHLNNTSAPLHPSNTIAPLLHNNPSLPLQQDTVTTVETTRYSNTLTTNPKLSATSTQLETKKKVKQNIEKETLKSGTTKKKPYFKIFISKFKSVNKNSNSVVINNSSTRRDESIDIDSATLQHAISEKFTADDEMKANIKKEPTLVVRNCSISNPDSPKNTSVANISENKIDAKKKVGNITNEKEMEALFRKENILKTKKKVKQKKNSKGNEAKVPLKSEISNRKKNAVNSSLKYEYKIDRNSTTCVNELAAEEQNNGANTEIADEICATEEMKEEIDVIFASEENKVDSANVTDNEVDPSANNKVDDLSVLKDPSRLSNRNSLEANNQDIFNVERPQTDFHFNSNLAPFFVDDSMSSISEVETDINVKNSPYYLPKIQKCGRLLPTSEEEFQNILLEIKNKAANDSVTNPVTKVDDITELIKEKSVKNPSRELKNQKNKGSFSFLKKSANLNDFYLGDKFLEKQKKARQVLTIKKLQGLSTSTNITYQKQHLYDNRVPKKSHIEYANFGQQNYTLKGDLILLKKAVAKELFTDEAIIIEIIGTRPIEHLEEINKVFNYNGKSLLNCLKKGTDANVYETCKSILKNRFDYDSICIFDSLRGIFGADLDSIYEILSGRTNYEITEIKKHFKWRYKIPLLEAIYQKVSSNLKDFFKILLTAKRNENEIPTEENIIFCYEKLKICLKNKRGDYHDVLTMLCTNSVEVLKLAFEMFSHLERNTYHNQLYNKFGVISESDKFLLKIVHSIHDCIKFGVLEIESSMRGIGMKEFKMIRLLSRFTRMGILRKIEELYEFKNNGLSLRQKLIRETTGTFRTLLIAFLDREESHANCF
ncbi:Annexin A1 [Lobulomyces angularis]|nr:Annexin A1 [Lobulomyces angularis]